MYSFGPTTVSEIFVPNFSWPAHLFLIDWNKPSYVGLDVVVNKGLGKIKYLKGMSSIHAGHLP